jgi:hypothetical protein
MADPANHIFLPWVQPGVAANIPDQATDLLTANQPSRVTLPVALAINNVTVPQTVRLYGPANVKGLDPQQIVRTEPKPGTNTFEPNYFAAIEFDRPDFPWLFTPAKADARGRLRPWLCLIVVRKQAGVELNPSSGDSLPALTIKDPATPATELPDLAESWVWAHAQMTGTDKSQIKATMVSDPARSVSRLLCPRRLEPATEYLACLVPAFEVGRKAGLGLAIDPEEDERLDPAWLSGGQSSPEIVLPIYYSWEFRTAADGDFEELVRLLEPRELPAQVGKRPMDISRPGFVIQPQATPVTLGLEGALRVVDSESDDWPDEARAPFQTALATILNTPWEILVNVVLDKDPIVAPPVYGCWQAGVHEVVVPPAPVPKSLPFWLDELNLDPRTRVAAGMGTRVIQDQQEALMASAWQQLGDIQKINQRMRQAQLSRAVNDRYHVRNFSRFSDETFLKIVAPAQSRLAIVTQNGISPVRTLLVQELARSMPPSVVSPALRKMTRPRGAINRQLPQNGSVGIGSIFNLLRPAPVGPFPGLPPGRGAVTIDQVSGIVTNRVAHQTIRDHRGPNIVVTEVVVVFNPVPPPGRFERVPDDFPQMVASFRLNSLTGAALAARQPAPQTPLQFFEAAKAHQAFLSNAFIQIIFRPPPIAINLQQSMSTIKAAALASLSPARTVTDAVMSSVQINSPKTQTGDDLEPIMDAPTFPQPMYEALRDLSQDFIFPGLDQVPANTVQLLETNAKFIESFLVGLNTEMGRELLWRGYPTDQRGTYFQQFWDTRTSATQPQLDIPPINQWGKRELGSTAAGSEGDRLVLLIRGELLRRYPNTVIYAVRAIATNGARDLSTKAEDERHPMFRGTLQPDVTFVGFDLTSDEVEADPGWFFVLQQQPTEPRFGLDEAPYLEGKTEVPALVTWNDLNWAHLAPDETALKELGFVSVGKFNLVPTSPVTGIWGRNSAHMAYITRQLPVRVAIHAGELLHAAK